jgi:hypothetical protein
MAFNDHSDWRWDERVMQTLSSVATSFRRLCDELTECLARFDGYADRVLLGAGARGRETRYDPVLPGLAST